MQHLHDTRAGRRAAAHASAHRSVLVRRPHVILGVLVGAALGAAVTTGLVAGPVSAEYDAVASLVQTDRADSSTSGAVMRAISTAKITEDAAEALADARTAVDDAEALTAEVAESGLDLDVDSTTIDTAEAEAGIAELSDADDVAPLRLSAVAAQTAEETEQVVDDTEALSAAFTAAQEKKAEEEAAAQAAAAALAAANTVEGAKDTAREMASSEYGWGADQFSCLESLWNKESGWDYQAYNASSGATGIPQALPGSKMASAGSDWQTNATTQIAWGLDYIDRAYGTPCSAWSHSQSTDWY